MLVYQRVSYALSPGADWCHARHWIHPWVDGLPSLHGHGASGTQLCMGLVSITLLRQHTSTQLVEPIFGPANEPQKIAGKKSDPKMCIPAKIGKVWISINIPFIFHWHIIYEPSIGPWLFHYHPTHHRWPCRCSSRWLRCHDHLCKLLDSHVANPRPAATSASRGHIFSASSCRENDD